MISSLNMSCFRDFLNGQCLFIYFVCVCVCVKKWKQKEKCEVEL